MKLEVWQKDMTIIADFARQLGCPTPLFAATAPIYTAATATGGQPGHGRRLCGPGGDGDGQKKFKVQSAKFKVSEKLSRYFCLDFTVSVFFRAVCTAFARMLASSLASCRSAASS